MGILSGLFEKRFHVSQEPPGWVTDGSGLVTASGVDVSEEQALQFTAVFACARILAESVASLPLHVYERINGTRGGKERAENHYLYDVLHDAPNPEMTSFQLRETMMGHLALWGNAYAEKVFNRAGRVMELWPLRPDRMRVVRENGDLVYNYRVTAASEEKELAKERVMHIPGFGSNGVTGYSMISLAREAIALGLATEEFGSRFFGNGARPGSVLEHPGKLGPEAHERLSKSWERSHGGLSKAHRVAILEEGLTLKEVGIPPEDAQFLQTRKFQRNEIAMIYRVPPHMLADLERATFSNIEHQSIEFVVHTLGPWLVRWEQIMKQSLFVPAERKRYFAEFLVAGLLRGDIQSRYEAYSVGRQNGWLSANDIRELENMNPIEGGDVYLIPLNMVAADDVDGGSGSNQLSVNSGQLSEGAGATHSGRASHPGVRGMSDVEIRQVNAAQDRHKLMLSQKRVFVDALARVLRRERNDLRRAARKHLKDGNVSSFFEWLESFYVKHQSFIGENMFPVTMAYSEMVRELAWEEAAELLADAENDTDMQDIAEVDDDTLEAFVHEYIRVYAVRHTARHAEKIRKAVQAANDADEDLVQAVDQEVDAWPDERSVIIADEESVRSNNATAELVYVLAGVLFVRWVAFGESCPYCSKLSGTVVGIKKVFLPVGDFQPDEADKPLKVKREIRHPPAHGGCDCMAVASI